MTSLMDSLVVGTALIGSLGGAFILQKMALGYILEMISRGR